MSNKAELLYGENNLNLKWVYGYDKVARKINKELKQMFEEKAKETEQIVNIYVKINGETIKLEEPPEFLTMEMKLFKEEDT